MEVVYVDSGKIVSRLMFVRVSSDDERSLPRSVSRWVDDSIKLRTRTDEEEEGIDKRRNAFWTRIG